MNAHSWRDVVVHHADALVVAVVLLRDVGIQLVEGFSGQRLPLLDHLVHAKLELRKLRLAEHGPLDAFEVAPEQ